MRCKCNFDDADRGRWEAIQANMPFGNTAGLTIEALFIDQGLEAAK